MHFEILVEDLSGKKALDILIRKIVGAQHIFNIYPYRGIEQKRITQFLLLSR